MSTITIKCNSCNKIFEIDLSEYDIEWEEVEAHVREMGSERNHEAVITGIECDNCGESIEVTINVWEYPDGSFLEPIISIDGGKLVDSDGMNDIFPSNDDDFDEDIVDEEDC